MSTAEAHEPPVDVSAPRSEPRRLIGTLLIATATALALGALLRQPTMMGANDISRWCTIWSLLERGTYVIDDCPWHPETQDKVQIPANPPQDGPDGQPLKHYYSSKPALLPTLIAGLLYPARTLVGVPLDRVVLQPREARWSQVPDPDHPGKVKGVLTTPDQPVKWPSYVYYFKPILILLNIIPFCGFLVLFARILDRCARTDWAWTYSLFAAAFGTYLLPYTQTLNNHTVAAFTAFFALDQFLRIWDDGADEGWRFALVGLLAGFTATNELPAAAFLGLLGLALAARYPARTIAWFVPFAALPLLALATSQYAAFGKFKLAYEEFGTDAYEFEGSLWKTPLELDALNLPWTKPEEAARRGIVGESYAKYLLHMTLGHHGFWSLSPIFLVAAIGLVSLLRTRGRLSAVAWLTLGLTVILLAFYTWNPKARNYGGSAQGLRWLFWLIPFWLLMLPAALDAIADRPWLRRLAVLALFVSVMSVGYAMRGPWSNPWIQDMIEHLGLYTLPR
ncbi:hypothetical protein [Paludisphaera mucosa]|uniref:Glycosyltransferase RgtA/B/C/D-like domain-containing protein n=1 Tax=Paludisphaera mucosa TaxID=3030827 RepID=A0ABT6F864_9BACT|nr:hypothetical protein [Paludisphaera mucosa]MDG3003781.1 hypothetical protein [Paludisphaera mucosa]